MSTATDFLIPSICPKVYRYHRNDEPIALSKLITYFPPPTIKTTLEEKTPQGLDEFKHSPLVKALMDILQWREYQILSLPDGTKQLYYRTTQGILWYALAADTDIYSDLYHHYRYVQTSDNKDYNLTTVLASITSPLLMKQTLLPLLYQTPPRQPSTIFFTRGSGQYLFNNPRLSGCDESKYLLLDLAAKQIRRIKTSDNLQWLDLPYWPGTDPGLNLPSNFKIFIEAWVSKGLEYFRHFALSCLHQYDAKYAVLFHPMMLSNNLYTLYDFLRTILDRSTDSNNTIGHLDNQSNYMFWGKFYLNQAIPYPGPVKLHRVLSNLPKVKLIFLDPENGVQYYQEHHKLFQQYQKSVIVLVDPRTPSDISYNSSIMAIETDKANNKRLSFDEIFGTYLLQWLVL